MATHKLYSCSDGVPGDDGGVCILVWAKNERYAEKQMALATARNGGDYDPDDPDFDITDVTDKIPAELCRTESGLEHRSKVERLAGWHVDGDRQCENCELYEMDGTYPVCEVCDQCSECGCAADCESRGQE